jgi:transcriptional regulator with XRE-family HTH domain
MKFWDRVKSEREKHGTSQGDMAKLLGISQPAYSRIEMNHLKVVDSDIVKVCMKLDIPINEALGCDEIIANLYTAKEKELLCNREIMLKVKQLLNSNS